jgi:hypothetical protein
MNHSFRVSSRKRFGDLNAQLGDLISVQCAPEDVLPERLSVQVFHRDERVALVLRDVVNGADIGMIQCRSGRASRWNRSSAEASVTRVSGRNFSATRPSLVSSALTTKQMQRRAEFYPARHANEELHRAMPTPRYHVRRRAKSPEYLHKLPGYTKSLVRNPYITPHFSLAQHVLSESQFGEG